MRRPRSLIYLHGLNSSGRSHKASVLCERLAPTPVLSPTYPAHRPDAAVAQLSDLLAAIAGAPAPLIVGSSMGGFYGQHLARHCPVVHLFLINPALTPWALLAGYQGASMTTADGEPYTLTGDRVEATRRYGIADPCDGVPTTVFLDQGDEVIDARIAARLYRRCGEVLSFPGGDHAFAHLDAAVGVIRARLELLEGDRRR